MITNEYIRCEDCGSDNQLDPSWRWAGDHWQHRCANVHPQVGHWRIDPLPLREEDTQDDPFAGDLAAGGFMDSDEGCR